MLARLRSPLYISWFLTGYTTAFYKVIHDQLKIPSTRLILFFRSRLIYMHAKYGAYYIIQYIYNNNNDIMHRNVRNCHTLMALASLDHCEWDNKQTFRIRMIRSLYWCRWKFVGGKTTSKRLTTNFSWRRKHAGSSRRITAGSGDERSAVSSLECLAAVKWQQAKSWPTVFSRFTSLWTCKLVPFSFSQISSSLTHEIFF